MNKLGKSFKHPRGAMLIAIWVITAISVPTSVILMLRSYSGGFLAALTYTVYGISALSLSYAIYTAVIYLPGARNKTAAFLKKHSFTRELLESFDARTIFSAVLSLAVSIGYGIFNGIVGILSFSVWYGALAGYYIVLAIIRSCILLTHKQSKDGDFLTELKRAKTYRNGGILLLWLNIALSTAIAQMIFDEKGFEYYGIMIYASALYTFIKIGASVHNFIKAQKQKDLVIKSVRNLSLLDATVSVLTLQTAMLGAFSNGDVNISLANTLTGSAVSIFAYSIAIYMICKGNKEIKKVESRINNGR